MIRRFGALARTDGGDTSRYSVSDDWQRTRGNGANNVTPYGIGYDLGLFSNFTFLLDHPVDGNQLEQADRHLITRSRGNENSGLGRDGRLGRCDD